MAMKIHAMNLPHPRRAGVTTSHASRSGNTHAENAKRLKAHRPNPRPTSAFTPDTSMWAQLPEKLRKFLNSALASHGGAASMTLNDWRDLELQLNRRLEK